MFGEKAKEYNAKKGAEVPVYQTPKYVAAKQKAVETIKSKEYNGVLGEEDFWILMNSSKDGSKMLYSGLIISHNGCLKINDAMPDEKRFKPSCVEIDTNGYNNSLVFTYINDAQGIYEVGEVSAKNCTNGYPYAMAFKRCFDRVVLKICKLAYAGIYSDSEADEFKQPEPVKDPEPTPAAETPAAETPAAETPAPKKAAAKTSDKEHRRAFINYCKENNLDLKEVCVEFHLNNDSSEEDCYTALMQLKTRALRGGN